MKKAAMGVFIAAAMSAIVAIACAPMFPKAIFVYSRHPDFPRTNYLKGKLGVVQPGYARSYLVIAYRYLRGPSLSADEQQQVREYWKDRESGTWDKTATDWAERWEDARVRVPGAAVLKKSKVTGGRFGYNRDTNTFELNCAEDAYHSAVQTLEDRAARFSLRSTALRSWRDAQDAVFKNCDATEPVIPPAATADLPPQIRADRDYQIAAAYFYANDFEEAETRFRRIAADSRSSWRWIAPYLVVRTLARAAQPDPGSGSAAQKAAEEVLAKPEYARLRGMTTVLLHRVILKQRDESYFHQLARDMMRGASVRGWREELWDYTTLYDKFVGYDVWEQFSNEPPKKIDLQIFARDDLSDWIYTFQRADSRAYDHALARWHKNGGLPWLVAALRHAGPKSNGVDELIPAAEAVRTAEPGYPMATYYRLALQIDSGAKPEAQGVVDRMLAMDLPKSALNLFRGLRMRTAPDLAGFLTFASRRPVMLTTDWNQGETPPWSDNAKWERQLVAAAAGKELFDRDSIKILNERTPLRLLRQAALSEQVPEYHRRDFVLTGFTRAVLLDDLENGVPLARKLRAIDADPAGYLEPYLNLTDAGERRFAAIYYLLHHPEARPYLAAGYGRLGRPGRIDDYRDNWWCPVDITVELNARTGMSWYGGLPAPRRDPDGPASIASFLTATDRQEAAQEMKRLAATRSGPDFLIDQTMRWARAHPQDPRAPEALHFALRSQRYGCVTGATAASAEKAWRYLWRRYPKDAWTRKTNYNFEPENLPTSKPSKP